MPRPKRKRLVPQVPDVLPSDKGAPFIEAPSLFSIAIWAAKRLLKTRAGEKIEAPIAIVFAALFLEAFINEVGVLAGTIGTMWGENPKEVFRWAGYWRKAEEARASIEDKFDFFHYAFRGKRFDQGRSPYQDFALLISVRNELVHLKPNDRILSWTPEKIHVEANPIVQKLVKRRVINPKELGAPASWVVLVSTREAAVWACNTAARMIQFVIELVPDCPFRRTLETLYRGCSKPLDER